MQILYSLWNAFTVSPETDKILRLLVTGALLIWNVIEGSVFQNEYPAAFIELYSTPLWRFLLLAALITGASWCPSVGLMLAFAMFFYVMDMEITLEKWGK
jgi:hypothetical protein